MINRELKEATLISYNGIDEYGQMLTTPSGTEKITMTLHIFSHSQTEDIRYNQVSHYGLTRNDVNDSQSVMVDGKEYKILFVNPHKRINEVFLCQK